eukprot:707628-Amphidinium_carterae.2
MQHAQTSSSSQNDPLEEAALAGTALGLACRQETKELKCPHTSSRASMRWTNAVTSIHIKSLPNYSRTPMTETSAVTSIYLKSLPNYSRTPMTETSAVT